VDQALTINRASAVHTNTGTIQVNANLTLTQSGVSPSFMNSGIINVASGKTMTVGGGGFTHGGTLSGPGGVTFNDGTVNFNAGFTVASLTLDQMTANFTVDVSLNSTALTVTDSTVNGGVTLTNPAGRTLTIDSSTVNPAVTNGGSLLALGTSAIAGAYTAQTGSTLQLGSGASSTLTIASGFANNGTIEMGSGGTSYSATLNVSAGALTNASGANINIVTGTGGSRTLGVQLNNQGTLTVNQALTINKASAIHTSAGTILVNANLTLTQTGTSPTFTNSGTITVAGAKTLSIGGGAFTNASSGVLQGTGTISAASATFTNSGNINPGTSPGILTFTGNLTQGTTGIVNVEIGGLTPGAQFDRLDVSGSAAFAGTLNVNLTAPYEPNLGDAFPVVNYGSKSGTFTTTNLPALSGGKVWKVAYNAASLTLTAGLPDPEINVRQDVADIPDNAGSFGFGNVNLGSNKVVSFTIENKGTGPLNLTGAPLVVVGGTHGADFVVTTPPSTPIPAGGSTTFAVTFTPGGVGARSATISIDNNDSDENPYNFALTATGVGLAEINVKQGGTNIPDNTGSYDFQNVTLGSNKVVTYTIENLGTGALNLTGLPKVQVSGANASDFAVTSQPSSPVVAGGSTFFAITFTPGDTGARNAQLSIANDDSDENPYNFAVSGTGVGAPEINVKAGSTSIPDGGTFTFGTVNVASGSAVTFTVENSGPVELRLTGSPMVQITGTHASDFVVTAVPSSPVPSGGSTNFTITFTPGAVGTRTASVSVANDDSDENPYNFNASGTGRVYPFPFLDDFSEDKGWSGYEPGGWERRSAVEGGGEEYGNPDPAADYTASGDNLILGYNIGGDYPNGLGEEREIVSPPVDCSGQADVFLKYRRWLNVEGSDADHAKVYVSSNGEDWHLVWENPGVDLTDDHWSQAAFDISGVAAHQETVFVKFTLGPTSPSRPFSGWNIDNVEVVSQAIYASEGTIGTTIKMLGKDYGVKKGKVLLGAVAMKVVSWTDTAIVCTLSKAMLPGLYDITVLRKQKGVPPVVEEDYFTVKNPEMDKVDPASGRPGDSAPIKIAGRFFGTKKGKVYLQSPTLTKACKGTKWVMDPTTGTSNVEFLVPKGLPSGDYNLTVTNKIGSSTKPFKVLP
jgi:hypothetical protein